MAVGVGGKGEGDDRYSSKTGTLVQRNAFSLFGRGAPEFTSFFWDGKVEVIDGEIYSEFGEKIENQFASPLEVASILPLLSRDEFIGKQVPLSSNQIQKEVEDELYYEKYLAVSKALRDRLQSKKSDEDRKLATALHDAGVPLGELELSHLGRLLANFIKINFPCNESLWDKYLSGQMSSLSDNQKNGAVLFFGKGRCASCHSGKFFSDFEFHSIGAPQGNFGPHSRHRDIGRADVTHRQIDLYKFRTPPLVDVSKTAPYGHNGAFPTLEKIVVHHFNPLAFYIDHPDYYQGDYFTITKLLSSRDSLLSAIDIDSTQEVKDIVQFLEAL